jgi:nucleotide-binding universal stress UspA family protein
VGGKPLLDLLRKKAEEGPRSFIVISPQSSEEAGEDAARHRLAETLKELEEAGLNAVGQVVHPDPFTAIENAIQFYSPDDIVISTLPETRSGWLRGDLIGRVEAASGKPVEHVVVDEAEVKA